MEDVGVKEEEDGCGEDHETDHQQPYHIIVQERHIEVADH